MANPAKAGRKHHYWRWPFFVLGGLLALLIVALVSLYFIDDPLKRRLQASANAQLQGYTAEIGDLDINPIGFTFTFQDIILRQNAHPDPPVVFFPKLEFSVEWKALLHASLVADVLFERPEIHIDRSQLSSEAKDERDVEEKGWQHALQELYPLEVNELRIREGSLTYIDEDPDRPLNLTEVDLLAEDIRNVRSRERVYPSELWARGNLFEDGRIELEGRADFMSEPHPGLQVDIDIDEVELKRIEHLAEQVNLEIRRGRLGFAGELEYAPQIKQLQVRKLELAELVADYVHRPETARAEQRRAEKVKEAGREVARSEEMQVSIDEFHLRRSTLGYVDRSTDPAYRIFLSDLDLSVRGFSDRTEATPARLRASGFFMGSGKSELEARFATADGKLDLLMDLSIEQTSVPAMNDLLRAYAGFDASSGRFSLYSEVKIENGQIDGYLKPLFQDIEIYEREQDAPKPLFDEIYEGIVEGLSIILQNQERDTVATRTDISGSIEEPETSTWDVLVHLVQNAFFEAILPGLEGAVPGIGDGGEEEGESGGEEEDDEEGDEGE